MSILALQTDSRGVSAVLVDRPKAGVASYVGCATVAASKEPVTLADALKAALPGLRGGRPELQVALGPEEARVRRLAVPPAPPEELPSIVAMQAAREAAADAEEIVADFLPPSEGTSETFVAWADRSTVAFWEEVATKLGGKLSVVTARPLATLSLVGADDAASVVVSRAGDSIDFAATVAETPQLFRSTHLGEGGDPVARRELSRTLLSLPDSSPSVLHTDQTAQGEGKSIDWPSVASTLGGDAEALRSLSAAAAIGLAVTAARDTTPCLNLAEPRQPPVVETGRRRQILLGATAATVLLAAAWMAYGRVADLDRQIEAKRAEIAEAEQAVEAFEPYRDRVAAIDDWRSSDVTWLDELERLSRKLRPVTLDGDDFPADSDVRVTQVRATALTSRGESGGKIELAAAARSSSTRGLEARLRDESHPVEPISIAENPAKDAYRFDYSALLRAPAAGEVVADPDEPTPAESSAEPAEEAALEKAEDEAEDAEVEAEVEVEDAEDEAEDAASEEPPTEAAP